MKAPIWVLLTVAGITGAAAILGALAGQWLAGINARKLATLQARVAEKQTEAAAKRAAEDEGRRWRREQRAVLYVELLEQLALGHAVQAEMGGDEP